MHILIKEQIAQLKVPMNDLIMMQVLQGIEDLQHEVPDLIFGQATFAFYHVVEGLVMGMGTLLAQIYSTM